MYSYVNVQNNMKQYFENCWFQLYYQPTGASLVTRTVKRLPTMQVTWVWSLGQEDPLEKERAIHSSIHAWKIPWTEEPGGISQMETSTLSVYNIQPSVKNIQYRLLCSHHTFYRYFHFSTYKLWLNICVYLSSTHLISCKLG